jgi:hypothetical protein
MKTKLILLFGIIAVFSSCSSAYRIGQTPDDVYYSPAPPQNEYVTSDNQQDKDSYASNNANNMEDLAIRRGINDPSFRNNISLDLGSGYYPYDSYGSSFYNPYNSYYNPYGYTGVTFYPYNNYYNNFYSPYNNYYSPYYNSYYPPLYYITKPGVPASNYNGPRQYNLGAYNINTNRTAPVTTLTTTTTSVPVRTFKPQPNTSGVGNFVRRIFTPSNNNSSSNNNRNNSNNNNYNNNNNNTTPARTFQPGTSSGNNNSSSGSSSGSAPVRTFRH